MEEEIDFVVFYLDDEDDRMFDFKLGNDNNVPFDLDDEKCINHHI